MIGVGIDARFIDLARVSLHDSSRSRKADTDYADYADYAEDLERSLPQASASDRNGFALRGNGLGSPMRPV
jgi:hypothetical protein